MKRKERTNYRKRLSLLKAGVPRLVIRKTDSMILCQVIDYKTDGDVTLASVYGKELRKYGWLFGLKNSLACYLAGYLLAMKSKARNVIPDKGNRTLKKDSFIYYVLKGAKDAGMNVHTDELPVSEDRLKGEHIMTYMASHKGNQFSTSSGNATNIKDNFNSVLEKITRYGK